MKKLKYVGLSLLMVSKLSSASVIAIVDSGNDFKHKDLVAKAWINPGEIEGSDRDNDHNGYQGDYHGWNFAEGNNILIDYSYGYSYNDDSKRFFEIQLKSFRGTITEEDKIWYKEKIKDEKFIKNLEIFGNWMHGTHVTGIATKNSNDSRAVGIKLIPTEVKLPGKKSLLIESKGRRSEQFLFDDQSERFTNNSEDKGLKDSLLMAALGALAKQQSSVFTEIGAYINGTHADVMNGSFGTPYSAIENLIGTIFKNIFKKEATKEELTKYTNYFFQVQLEETKKFLSSAPNTLFVFAAGNEGTNNDVLPTSPANVQGENRITVAAAMGNQALAVFSNYGANNVDVAAPGVGIVSTIPMDHYIAVSGTSQASPYVANIAGIVKDINPKLGFREIKKIILETVDVKEWLKGKVKTQGLVNRDRAIRAAQLSVDKELKVAIAQSKIDVLEKTENELINEQNYHQVPKDLVLPLPNPIKISL